MVYEMDKETVEVEADVEVKCPGYRRCKTYITPGNDTWLHPWHEKTRGAQREYCDACGNYLLLKQQNYNLLRRDQRRLNRLTKGLI